MLRLRGCIVSGILSSSSASTSPISSLHRLISAAAPAMSPNPSFAVEEYLVDTCGLTRPQALKASPKLSHLKSPTNPDAVLGFLAGIGLSGADVATLVAKDPKFLCASVERTLSPIVDGLAGLGLSPSEIARLISLAAGDSLFRSRAVVSKLQYYLPLFDSFENLIPALKSGSYIMVANLETTVKPNVALLRECGLDACDISKLCRSVPRLIITKPERVRAMVASAEGLGVLRGTAMLRHALDAIAFLSEDQIAAKMGYLKKTFRWSDAEVGMAVSKNPFVLNKSKESLHRRSEFLFSEVGLEPAYIARRPVILTYRLEGRLRPRYYVVKFLMENGLLKRDPTYNTVFKESDKVFAKMFICPHKEAAPHLTEDYADACRGQMPTRFIFTCRCLQLMIDKIINSICSVKTEILQ